MVLPLMALALAAAAGRDLGTGCSTGLRRQRGREGSGGCGARGVD